jgi:thiamine biosynthesis lipoprotein
MSREAIERFACFGGTCEVRVAGEDGAAAAARARRKLLAWHDRFTRFTPDSELSRLNADPREEVPATGTMLAFADAVSTAGERTGGLVDGTLADEIAAAGYPGPHDHGLLAARPAANEFAAAGGSGGHDHGVSAARAAPNGGYRAGAPLPLALALRLAPRRRPAGASPHAGWRHVVADREARVVRRPPGVALDSGGLAKGLFADVLADELAAYPGFVVNCAGDVRIGGAQPRPVRVASPFDHAVLHTFALAAGAAATSGITRRSWLDASGRPAHHLLDPATGSPAFTGVIQATALAPTALEAEALAKAALLSGPAAAPAWLPHGGVLVLDDGTHQVVP